MSGEPLILIPNCTLYKVLRASHDVSTIASGDLNISYEASAGDAALAVQVGLVSWPLSRATASLRFDDHTYAFELPTGSDSTESSYYCLTLQPDTHLELIDLLQAVLASGSAYHDQQHLVLQPGPSTAQQRDLAPELQQGPAVVSKADRIAEGIQRGGQVAAAGVLAAAVCVGAALHKGAEAAVARMQPAERPTNISPQAQARLEKAKALASQVADVSGRAVSSALGVTAQVAGALAKTIASSELARSVGRSRVAGASAQDLRKVGAAGIDAVEAVYDSLADAARIVLAHTHTAATRIVGHKYGADAALATGAGIQVAQSAVEAGLNVYKLRPTALVKKVIKGTAQNVVLGGTSQQQQAALPPQAAPQQGSAQQQLPPPAHQQQPHALTPQGPVLAQSPPTPVAAVSTLAAVTAGGQRGASAGAGAGGSNGSGGPIVDGVVVTGPVPAHPVVVDYTPSAAVAYGATVSSGPSGGLPYPAVSQDQYAARYYPSVPRA